MNPSHDDKPIRRVLVMMPGSLPEAVTATALLQALRQAHPDAHITALIRRRLRPVLWGLDCADRVLSVRKRMNRRPKDHAARDKVSLVQLGRRLSRGGFDTAIILPSSFRAAALAAVAGIPRRIGYEREGRGVLLTDRLVQRRHRGALVPVPTLDRYLGIARYLGATTPMSNPQQAIKPAALHRADEILAEYELHPDGDLPLLLFDEADHHCARWVVENRQQQIDLGDVFNDLHLLKAVVSRSRAVASDSIDVASLAQALSVPVVSTSDAQSLPHRVEAGV